MSIMAEDATNKSHIVYNGTNSHSSCPLEEEYGFYLLVVLTNFSAILI